MKFYILEVLPIGCRDLLAMVFSSKATERSGGELVFVVDKATSKPPISLIIWLCRFSTGLLGAFLELKHD